MSVYIFLFTKHGVPSMHMSRICVNTETLCIFMIYVWILFPINIQMWFMFRIYVCIFYDAYQWFTYVSLMCVYNSRKYAYLCVFMTWCICMIYISFHFDVYLWFTNVFFLEWRMYDVFSVYMYTCIFFPYNLYKYININICA